MRAGALRHFITIRQPVETQDGAGGLLTSWQNVANVWAEVVDLSGREYFSAQQVSSEVTTRIRIRYRSGVIPKMQVKDGDVDYDILAVLDPTGRREELHLMCRRVNQ